MSRSSFISSASSRKRPRPSPKKKRPSDPMSLQRKLAPVKARHEEIAALMSAGNLGGEKFVALSREYAELTPVVEVLESYEKTLAEMNDLEAMKDDPEMGAIAREEYY